MFCKLHDKSKLIKMALVHDLGEALIGDIKWESGNKVVASQIDKHRDESKAINQLFLNEKSHQEYINLWNEFNDQKTKVAKALKLIDKLEMALQAYEYKKEGYENLDEFFENAEKYLKGSVLGELYNEIS